MRAIGIGGTALHVKSEAGPPGAPAIVFINSLGSDFRIWDGVADRLRGRFSLVFHDKRGHGLSGHDGGPASIAAYAQDLERVLEKLGAERIVLCGLSVGGLIAQWLTLRSGLEPLGVVLSNTGLKIGSDETWNTRIAAVESKGIEAIAGGVMERWFSPEFRAAEPDQAKLYRAMLTRTPAAGYIACCQAIRDAEAFDHRAAPRRVPTLCIGGSVDGATPPALVRAMADHIPGADYVEFEGAGHLPCVERPERYAEVLARFAGAL